MSRTAMFDFEKQDAVHEEVIAQLRHDQRDASNLRLTMAAGHLYGPEQIATFLRSVADRLAHRRVAYAFSFTPLIATAGAMSVRDLIIEIDGLTHALQRTFQ